MGLFLPRKLLSASINRTLSEDLCFLDCDGPQTCYLACMKLCSKKLCKLQFDDDGNYKDLSPKSHHHDGIKRLTIISISVLASLFLLACLLTVYIKSKSRSRARARSASRSNVVEFLDEDHGPVVEHPIWYIRTVGLQPSVISSIPVCRYKSGDGLVEETDCSVCLSQFEEDETLRLLPKCNHAFHVDCIDTWLSSHTNCPLCRAPIVANAAAPASSSSSGVRIRIPEETQVEIQQEHQEPGNDIGEREDLPGDTDVPGMQRVRRSVSMETLSASKISQAVLDRNRSGFGSTRTKEPNRRILRLARSSSVVGRSFLKRSASCSAKFLLPR